jgi:uncharacterized SAM-binding protein YcdF (DUF218 family)
VTETGGGTLTASATGIAAETGRAAPADRAGAGGRVVAGRRSAIRDIALAAGALALGAALALGYTGWRVWSVGQADGRRPADAIVVMGAAQYDGRPSPVFAARLDHAIELYKAGLAPYLVVTGGRQEGDRTTEAATARAYAIARGVPEAAILAEDTGRTTLQSLENVAAVFGDRGLRSALFVSDRMHMLRVLRLARDQGIVGYSSPTTTSPSDATAQRTLNALRHEIGALVYYALTGQGGNQSEPAP